MEQNLIRHVFYYKNYYPDFYKRQTKDVQKKFNWTLELIEKIERVPKKYFDHITGTDGIANAFQKKSQKTPINEIELAKKIKKEYFNEKSKK